MSLLINVDNGGTFTDICILSETDVVRAKALTTPYDLTKCFTDVLKSGSKALYGQENLSRLLKETDYIRYSTTAGTNAIVQKKGPRLGLLVREGTDPAFLTVEQSEKEMFEVMVGERVAYVDPGQQEQILERSVVKAVNQLLSQGANRIIVSLDGLDRNAEEKKIKKIFLEKYPRHLLGSVPVLFSHELVDDEDDRTRTWTALINSFLHPVMESFLYNAEKFLRNHRTKNPLLIFQNDGNSTRVAKTTAVKTYGSGPRGGMEGARALAGHYRLPKMLTMDIGGTTTDVGLVDEGKIKEKVIGEIEGIPTSFSLCDLISVGVGGSSVFRVENGEICVGPDSVGAVPGPACFGRGGQEATITDAYLLMGILNANSYFGGNLALDESRARRAVEEKIARPLGLDLESGLLAMERAYVEKIAQGISQYMEVSDDTTLLAFGGAGPMVACRVAEAVGIRTIIIPRLASVFSAFGITFSDIAHEYEMVLREGDAAQLEDKVAELHEKARRDMFAEGFDIAECRMELGVRYVQDGRYELVPLEEVASNPALRSKPCRLYLKVVKPIHHFAFQESGDLKQYEPETHQYKSVLHPTGWETDIPVFRFEDLQPGAAGRGPALIEEELFTCRVTEGWKFYLNENRDLFLYHERGDL